LIKANPGKYSFAHTGIGTTPHLSGEMFKLASAIDIVAVPFNGGAPAAHSAVAGHTPILFTSVSGGVPLVRDGKPGAAVAAKAAGASGCANLERSHGTCLDNGTELTRRRFRRRSSAAAEAAKRGEIDPSESSSDGDTCS
jgi:tripartite-type tricarboxylate transporter receptor subunit TctC